MTQNIEYYQSRFEGIIDEINTLSRKDFQLDYSTSCVLSESGKKVEELGYREMIYFLLGMLKILRVLKKVI